MELLFPLPDDSNVKYINDRLKLYFKNDEVLVYYDNIVINKYNNKDNEYRKFVIIQLARIGAANFNQLCTGFEISSKTLEKYLKMSLGNFEDMQNKKTGPKKSWKIDYGLRLAIIKIYVNNDNIADREIVRKVKQQLNVSVDHKTVAKVLTEAGLRQKKKKYSKNDDDKSLKNDNNVTIKKSIDLFDSDENNKNDINNLDNVNKNKSFKEKLENGIETIYGASLIFPTIENNEKLHQAFQAVYGDIKTDSEFSNKMFLDSLVQQSLLDEYTKDSFDHFEDEDFGVLLHNDRGPNTKEISDFLAEVARQNKAELFSDTLSSMIKKPAYKFTNADNQQLRYRIIYIDGHFDPYYYKLATFKGFHTVRRLVMKGDVSFSICDDNGLPIVCTRKTANPKLNKIIPELLTKLRKILDDDEILIIVFDKEGFDKELFWHIKQLDNTYLISWDKHDNTASQAPDEKFNKSLDIKLTGTNKLNVNYFTTTKKFNFDDKQNTGDSEKRILKMKKYCIHDQNSDKKSSLISDVPDDFLDDSFIIKYLLIRQRQENFHKSFKNNKGWDHYTTHLTINKRRNHIIRGIDVPNPEIKSIEKQRSKLNSKINKLLNEFGKANLDKNIPDDTTKQLIHKKYHKILSEIETLTNEKNELLEKKKKLPTHLPIEQAYPEKTFYQRDFEEKSFIEAIKLFAYCKEQNVAFQAAEFCRLKDRFLFLKILKKRICKISAKGNQLLVKIKSFSSPKFQQAAEKLLAGINGHQLKFSNDNKYDVSFELY